MSGFSRLYLALVPGRITTAAQEVYNPIEPGFEEKIYQRALALELPAQVLETAREVWLDGRDQS